MTEVRFLLSMRKLAFTFFLLGVVGFVNYYLGSWTAFRDYYLTAGNSRPAYTECLAYYGLPLKSNGNPTPIDELSTENRNVLLGCALKSGSYRFVRWALQKPKEMLSINSRLDGRWPLESVARWSDGPEAVDAMRLILESNDVVNAVSSSASPMVALYEVSTVDAAKYLAERYSYLLLEDNRKYFTEEDYPKYLGLTLAQYHAYAGRIDVAEYFSSKGSRIDIPGMDFRRWLLAKSRRNVLDDRLDAFLTKHGVSRDNREIVPSGQLLLASSAVAVPRPPQMHSNSQAIGNSEDVLWRISSEVGDEDNVFLRWNPTTGRQKEYILPVEGKRPDRPRLPRFDSATYTGDGLVFDSYVSDRHISNKKAASVTLATDDGRMLTTHLSVSRSGPHKLVLADRSILFIGGNLAWHAESRIQDRSNAVERVFLAMGKLETERLPDLPGPARTSFAMAALPDGRVMVLGGTNSISVGCSPCFAETYLLDVAAKQWTAGPPMMEARANPTVTVLPDGSLLVAGGWTPGHGDGGWGVTSATTERWSPASGRFTSASAMPTGMAMHRAVWAAGQKGRTLVLAGGNSAAVLVYDVARNSWQVAAELCEPHQTENVFPFKVDGNSYLWLMDGKAGWCKEDRYDDGDHNPRSLVSLRMGSVRFDPQVGIALNRRDFVFVPGTSNGPSYVVGGRVDGNNQRNISDAYAIWPEGRIEHVAAGDIDNQHQADMAILPPLTWARRGSSEVDYARMVTKKLADGRVVVAGGEVQVHKIAVVTEKSTAPGTLDTYIGIGEYLPSRDYEVFEPGTGTWRNSAPSIGIGGLVAVFDDGRVAKLGRQATQTSRKESTEGDQYLLEISSPDGRHWTHLDDPLAIRLSSDARPFVIQNELFLSGRLPEKGGGSDTDAVLWLDSEHNRWETLWQIDPGDNWRSHIGRIIVRTLPNGKRIVMPVGGF